MRRLSKGIWIRLAIYLPIIGYLAYRALAPAAPRQSAADKLAPHRTTITTPDGRPVEIYEMTPKQAEEALGHPLPAAPRHVPTEAPTPDSEPKPEPPQP